MSPPRCRLGALRLVCLLGDLHWDEIMIIQDRKKHGLTLAELERDDPRWEAFTSS